VANSIQPAASQPAARSWSRTVIIGRNPGATRVRVTVLLALGLVCFVVFKFVLLPVRVSGISMLPTYRDHSINFINRLAYWRDAPQRGDIVAITFSTVKNSDSALEPPHIMLVKRIIGLPGDTVGFANGHAVINGAVLDEPYEKFPCDWNRRPVKLAPDEYFVVGDNRSMPQQDHEFGVCKRYQIVGKALL
jgi:signal peptidase I